MYYKRIAYYQVDENRYVTYLFLHGEGKRQRVINKTLFSIESQIIASNDAIDIDIYATRFDFLMKTKAHESWDKASIHHQ